jgi:hypothetical protein
MEKNKMIDSLKSKMIESSKKYYSGYNITDTAIFHRAYDNMFEVLGLVPDPTVDEREFFGREILFPKKWVTLKVFSHNDLEVLNGN